MRTVAQALLTIGSPQSRVEKFGYCHLIFIADIWPFVIPTSDITTDAPKSKNSPLPLVYNIRIRDLVDVP